MILELVLSAFYINELAGSDVREHGFPDSWFSLTPKDALIPCFERVL